LLAQSGKCISESSGPIDRSAVGGEDQAADNDDPASKSIAAAQPGLCRVVLTLEAADADPPLSDYLSARLSRIAALAGVGRGTLTVAVVDDRVMGQMHSRYRGCSGTTDVLTFDHRNHRNAPLEADIVVCVDEAVRQADLRGHDTRDEILLYAVHGLLHLMGYDDHDPQAAAVMHAREDELLTAAGVGSIYHAGGRHID
jgi:probable rRNA maturation factor